VRLGVLVATVDIDAGARTVSYEWEGDRWTG
jgi:hypothetical protein